MIYPEQFLAVPASLEACEAAASDAELSRADDIRRQFCLDGTPMPYMVDIVRGFRLARGRRLYVEVGTRDKGNLAYASTLLADDATLIDIDIEECPENEARLRRSLRRGQTYVKIVGDSVSPAVMDELRRALDGRGADLIFCDSSHLYEHTLGEYALYKRLLREDGFLFFHDVFWEGNAQDKGKAQAIALIDRFDPVYAIFMTDPVHRWIPLSGKGDSWGGLGILCARNT